MQNLYRKIQRIKYEQRNLNNTGYAINQNTYNEAAKDIILYISRSIPTNFKNAIKFQGFNITPNNLSYDDIEQYLLNKNMDFKSHEEKAKLNYLSALTQIFVEFLALTNGYRVKNDAMLQIMVKIYDPDSTLGSEDYNNLWSTYFQDNIFFYYTEVAFDEVQFYIDISAIYNDIHQDKDELNHAIENANQFSLDNNTINEEEVKNDITQYLERNTYRRVDYENKGINSQEFLDYIRSCNGFVESTMKNQNYNVNSPMNIYSFKNLDFYVGSIQEFNYNTLIKNLTSFNVNEDMLRRVRTVLQNRSKIRVTDMGVVTTKNDRPLSSATNFIINTLETLIYAIDSYGNDQQLDALLQSLPQSIVLKAEPIEMIRKDAEVAGITEDMYREILDQLDLTVMDSTIIEYLIKILYINIAGRPMMLSEGEVQYEIGDKWRKFNYMQKRQIFGILSIFERVRLFE